MDAWDELNAELMACRRCPRLVEHRETVARVKRRAYREWTYWGKPVPGFGDPQARLLLVGLAPGAHGSNRTGRMFTGDSSGDTLYAALYRAGFANQPQAYARDDGLVLRDVFITAVARCAPPDNRPSPEELRTCLPFLVQEMGLLTQVRVMMALGAVAWHGMLTALRARGAEIPALPFAHGAVYPLPAPWPVLMATYHPSRQNTQTGRLTPAMLDAVLTRAREYLDDLHPDRPRIQ